MQFIAASSLAIAQDYENRAFNLCLSQGNKGGRWSEIFTDNNGRFAVVWDNSIAAAFGENEILMGVVDEPVENWVVYSPPQEDIAE